MKNRIGEILRRARGKSPGAMFRWLKRHAVGELDQILAPLRDKAMTPDRLCASLGAADIDQLWTRLAARPYPFPTKAIDGGRYERLCPGDAKRIFNAAEDAMAHKINLLGSGPVTLGPPPPACDRLINWHCDFKSGHHWPMVPFRRIDTATQGLEADIKIPWELSRLQWLIPVGQAYLLSGEDRYAQSVRSIIEDWIAANPIARGVNWACTMDIALRGVMLVWLFRVFHDAPAWSDPDFRTNCLLLIHRHGDFASRHLEFADVNGNHLLADAAGIVFLGLFFGDAKGPAAWAERGWSILTTEIASQVYDDGADFEGSIAYHRLVTELFTLPAFYRRACGLEIPQDYINTLHKMAGFIAAYSRDDGSTPLNGDADDGRFLPMGGQDRNDHRYLCALISLGFDGENLNSVTGPQSEVFWLLGDGVAGRMKDMAPSEGSHDSSRGFASAGIYIMRGGGDHVLIDCGPVGMAGRGGHGHNDCLSFEAALDGSLLIVDRGTYVYTADPAWRNRFRGTAFHSTPMIDGEEQNRFVDPAYLWVLFDDAKPDVRQWTPGKTSDVFVGAHAGYRRLNNPVVPVRRIELDKTLHRLIVIDSFEEDNEGNHHLVSIPYHLSPDITVTAVSPGVWELSASGGNFLFVALGENWSASLQETWHSVTYGVKEPATAITFERNGTLQPLVCAIIPSHGAPPDPVAWLSGAFGL